MHVTDVLDVEEGRGTRFAVLRGAAHHLRAPATRGRGRRCEVLPVRPWPPPVARPGCGPGPVTLVGQLPHHQDV